MPRMSTGKPVAPVWHYTTGTKLRLILADGFLRPTDHLISKGESPILWFSRDQYWEQTANKGVEIHGFNFTLSMEGTAVSGAGLFRFGVLRDGLINWPQLGKAAGMKSKVQRGLEKAAIKMGSDCSKWLGSLEPIRVRDCHIQGMNPESRTWIDF